MVHGPALGRGANLNPGNRFEGLRLHVLGEFLDHDAVEEESAGARPARVPTTVYQDESRSVLNRAESPDLPFSWSFNPYRGCEHGCVYCYARPGHEYLSMSCGLDFETKILAKPDAPALLRRALASPSWLGEPIAMSGVTDCYQPIERRLGITRACLEVMAQCGQPVSVITKNRLVERDVDLLADLAGRNAARVAVSITTLDASLARKLEPRASTPQDRLALVGALRAAGVPTMVMVAPVIPGLNDREIPGILRAAREAGAQNAGYVLLRLPHQVKALFLEWLQRHVPERARHIENLIRSTRDGDLNDPNFGTRMTGKGPFALALSKTFRVFAARAGLDKPIAPLSSAAFRRPALDGQMGLFGG